MSHQVICFDVNQFKEHESEPVHRLTLPSYALVEYTQAFKECVLKNRQLLFELNLQEVVVKTTIVNWFYDLHERFHYGVDSFLHITTRKIAFSGTMSPQVEAHFITPYVDIEKAYWKRFGVRAEQVLRDDVSKIKAYNLLNYINYYDTELSDSELRKFVSALLDDVIEHPYSSLRESLKAVSSSLKVNPSHCMTLFANSMFKHILPIDLTQKIKLHKPLNLCTVVE